MRGPAWRRWRWGKQATPATYCHGSAPIGAQRTSTLIRHTTSRSSDSRFCSQLCCFAPAAEQRGFSADFHLARSRSRWSSCSSIHVTSLGTVSPVRMPSSNQSYGSFERSRNNRCPRHPSWSASQDALWRFGKALRANQALEGDGRSSSSGPRPSFGATSDNCSQHKLPAHLFCQS